MHALSHAPVMWFQIVPLVLATILFIVSGLMWSVGAMYRIAALNLLMAGINLVIAYLGVLKCILSTCS
jgi:hypothetical protein